MGGQSHEPIYAEANGNTFLIFDYLDKYEHDFDESIIRRYHKPTIDSCLVLTKANKESTPTQFQGLNSVLLMRMYVYEPGDGFCGNGARAVAKYCFNRYKDLYSQFFIVSDDRIHELLQRDTEYLVEMGKSLYNDSAGDFIKKGILDNENKFVIDDVTLYYVYTSEPHLVTFDRIPEEKLISIGNSLNQDQNKFPIGINLNRVSIRDESTINVLTFERGINRLTLACGSGSTSCVALSKHLGRIDQAMSRVTVNTRGGDLVVFNENDKVYLSGSCLVEGLDNIEHLK